MRRTITTVAAIVLVAGAAHAQGNGRGPGGGSGGHGGGGDHAAPAQGGGGGGGKPDKGRQGGGQAANAPAQGGGNKDRGNGGGGNGGGGEARPDRGNGNASAANDRGQGQAGRGNGNGNGSRDMVDRGRDNDRIIIDDRSRGRDVGRDVVRVRDLRAIPARGFVGGCPPGLAKKNPPCIPPGQVRSPFRSFDRPDFWGLRLGDGRYRYDDGYLLRLGADGRIGGYIPLLGGALAIGNPWPAFYQPVALPVYYESYYGLGPYNSYRYADNVIYQIDPETAAITSIAALLTGDDFTVGRAMPVGYDVYNVPYAYRTQYADTPDAWYRYSDGYVYQIDPETRLVAAAIELLAS